jgi:hypothetical protein
MLSYFYIFIITTSTKNKYFSNHINIFLNLSAILWYIHDLELGDRLEDDIFQPFSDVARAH